MLTFWVLLLLALLAWSGGQRIARARRAQRRRELLARLDWRPEVVAIIEHADYPAVRK
jgi:hypothetical protein